MIGIRTWHQDNNLEGTKNQLQGIPTNVIEAFRQQTKIGWGQLAQGKSVTNGSN